MREWRVKGGWGGLRGQLYKLMMELSKKVKVKIEVQERGDEGRGSEAAEEGGVQQEEGGGGEQQEQSTEAGKEVEVEKVVQQQVAGCHEHLDVSPAKDQLEQQQQPPTEANPQAATALTPLTAAHAASTVNTSSSTPTTPAAAPAASAVGAAGGTEVAAAAAVGGGASAAAGGGGSAAGGGGDGDGSVGQPLLRLSLQYCSPSWPGLMAGVSQVQQLARLIAAADAREVLEAAAKAAGVADHMAVQAAIAAAAAAAADTGADEAAAAGNTAVAPVTSPVTASDPISAVDPAGFATAVAATVAAAEVPSSSKQLLGVVEVPQGWQSGKKFSGQVKLPGGSSLLTVAADDDPSKVAAAVDCAAIGLMGPSAVTNSNPGRYRWGDVEVMMLVLCRQCPWLREQTLPAAANAR
jgi:hypothetical protein